MLVDVRITDVLVSEYLTTWLEGKHALGAHHRGPVLGPLEELPDPPSACPSAGPCGRITWTMYASIQVGKGANSSRSTIAGASTVCCTRH